MTDHRPTAVQYGVGPIGSRIATAARQTGFEFVGAVDVDPVKVGADLGEVAGFDDTTGVEVTDDATSALAAGPDVVFHSTVSDVEAAVPQLTEILATGANVVSTTEELAYPQWSAPEAAAALDEAAREHDATVLGAGINPGFVMDAMPAYLSTPLRSVTGVTVERVQDAAARREPLQRKVGAGVPLDAFEREIATGAGHIGSAESVAMLGDALGFDVDAVEETVEPVVAEERIETEYLAVEAGEVAGVRQVAHGTVAGETVVTLDLQMYVGADEPRDVVHFESEPPVSVTVEGGYHGDLSTSAVVVNVAPTVIDAEPGLANMTDLTPSFTGEA